MREVTKLTDNKFLNLYSVKDPQNHVNGYQYAERLGINSIAFICYDRKTKMFLLNNEYKPPVNAKLLGAFGGSIDKDKTHQQIVVDEVKEEAGFEVSHADIVFMGGYFVSTQMNQFCNLYLVYVDRAKQGERQPENKIEAMAIPTWMTEDEIMRAMDWKAITIISRAKWMKLFHKKVVA